MSRRHKFVAPGMRVRLDSKADREARLLGFAAANDATGEIISRGLTEDCWRVAFPMPRRRRIVALRSDQMYRLAPRSPRLVAPPEEPAVRMSIPPGALCSLLV